jgi:outer membrane protein
MKKTLLALAMTACVAPAAHADFLGLYVGGGQWQQDFSGTIQNGEDRIDMESDLGADSSSGMSFYAAFEHPLPFIPNVRFEHTTIDDTITATMNREFTYGDQTYNANESVTTNLDLSHNEYFLYYEILDNWVNLDIGFSVKHFDNQVEMRSNDQNKTETTDLSAYLPMLYAYGQFDLPFTGLSAGLGGSMISYDGSAIKDWKAMLRYETDMGFGLEGGFRAFEIELDDVDDLTTDASFEGFFVNVTYHF